MLKKYNKIIIRLSLVIIFIVLMTMYIYISPINSVVNLVILSFIISYSLKPIRDYISEKFKITSRKSALIIILIAVFSIIFLLYLLVPTIIRESGNFGLMLDNIEEYFMDLMARFKIDKMPIFETVYIQLGEKLNMFLSNLSANLLDEMINMMENLLGFAVVPVIAYYFLADGSCIYNKFLLIFSTEKRILVKRINSNIDRILSRYIMSQLLLSFIIGIATFIILIILGVKLPLLLSVINAIANIIPYFGPVIGGIPIIFIALTGSATKGILALIGVILIQQIEGNLLAPKITGDSTNMHPIIIIILLILGEKIGGAVGMILVVPIAVIIKVIYDDIEYYLF